VTEEIDEVELFEHGGYVCAVRTTYSTRIGDTTPWHQGIVYLKGGATKRSNWYLKPEDAVKMAKVMVRQEKQ
jgi:hypothetical protein